eukprot:TRINITY_DN14_c0_g2_i1.p1 TRINITY_DN14_c0_g2~~TRINITY_DN14_c0_g2_i1.p1  ORF type:complete len:169 (-),score=20.01 TRINITY_DN14_c0_g2_i1:57-563(-)
MGFVSSIRFVLCLVVAAVFFFLGLNKVSSEIASPFHNEVKTAFDSKITKLWTDLTKPYFQFPLKSTDFRLTIGVIEQILSLLVLQSGFLGVVSNILLLIISVGGAYTHYALNDPNDVILVPSILAIALFLSLLLRLGDRSSRTRHSHGSSVPVNKSKPKGRNNTKKDR